ncbi:merozoite surface protein 3b [Stutzerimonas stutzeri]|uniref:Merozoite surface protein 3b n=1 Tax=Stutzerimonas stutzeri TaxID=316 RepID=A0AA40RWM0_STUST|nr:merozoite surface protein 3b [Stutzerimonas stutzeri]MBA1306018.1 merozoite surface protein 3b [Stutzerimonas stutzeri]
MTLPTTNYLERAVAALNSLGINVTGRAAPAPILPLLEKVKHYDEHKVVSIAAALQQSSSFHQTAREQLKGLDVSHHYQSITDSFNSIRADSAKVADWVSDGSLDLKERLMMSFMKLRRGSIAERFDSIRNAYQKATEIVGKEIQREEVIRNAYQDYHLAMVQTKINAEQVLEIATRELEARRKALGAANEAIEAERAGDNDPVVLAKLDLASHEALRAFQLEDKSYQIAKDMAEDLAVGLSTTRVIMAHLEQSAAAKERLHQRMISFFTGQESVLTALSVAFTASNGLSAATNVLKAQKAGTEAAIESLAQTGNQAIREAITVGYGAALDAHPVKMLGESIVQLQSDMIGLISAARTSATSAAQEIETATEQNERAFTALIAKAN